MSDHLPANLDEVARHYSTGKTDTHSDECWKWHPECAVIRLCYRASKAEALAATYASALAQNGYWPICLDCLRPVDWDVHARCERREQVPFP